MFRGLITSQALPAYGEFVRTDNNYEGIPFIVPDGVRQISCVLVGAGASADDRASGGGGSLVYATIPVTPGQALYITVGTSRGSSDIGGSSYISTERYDYDASSAILLAPGGDNLSDNSDVDDPIIPSDAIVSGSYAGGASIPASNAGGGGGGAGGYSGVGGIGGYTSNSSAGSPGSGGGGGGGGGSSTSSGEYGGFGGGVGLYGEGSSGAGGSFPGGNGGDGSGGSYGGGAGAAYSSAVSHSGRDGAVRIVWPGQMRRFPSTRVS